MVNTNDQAKYFLAYLVASTAIGVGIFNKIVNESLNYYIVGIQISQGLPLIVLSNFIIVWSLFLGKSLQYLIFGELRLIEIEHLYERAWYTITSLIMSIAMFTDENNIFLLIMILGLLFLKIFHWILIDRLDFLFQQHQMDSNFKIFNIIFNKCTLAWLILLKLDYEVIVSCIDESFTRRTKILLVFAFDFLMIYLNLLKSSITFVLNLYELFYLDKYAEEEIWENKVWISKILLIFLGIFKLVAVSVIFFGLLLSEILPISFTGEIYMSIIELSKLIKDFYFLIKAAKALSGCISDPTLIELESNDLCIICRDDMILDLDNKWNRNSPKKLQCGHILHYGCLKSWLERSHCCPTCRSDVFKEENNVESNNDSIVNENIEPIEQEMVDQINQNFLPNSRNVSINDNRNDDDEINNENNNGVNNENNYATNNEETNIETKINRLISQNPGISIELNNQLNKISNNTPTRTIPASASASTSTSTSSLALASAPTTKLTNSYSITLPSDTIIPPDWTLLPLFPLSNDEAGQKQYLIQLNKKKMCRLRIDKKSSKIKENEFEKYTLISIKNDRITQC